jgi:hypothetical protein
MDAALDLMGMHGPLRQAVRIMKGLRLTLTDNEFDLVVVSVIPLLKVKEKCAASHNAIVSFASKSIAAFVDPIRDMKI